MDATLQAARRRWLRERQTGIGGSDVANILGEGYQSPLDVYLSKVGDVEDSVDNRDARRGRWLEPLARDLYAQETGYAVEVHNPFIVHRDAQHPELIASIDGAVFRDDLKGKAPAVLEIKCPSLKVFQRVKDYGMPKAYVLQLQHYLGITGAEIGTFVVFSAERAELLHFDVQRDDELLNVVRRMIVEWWKDHVVARKPPVDEPMPLPVDVQVAPGELVVNNTAEWAEAVADLFDADDLRDMAGELYEQKKAALVAMMGDAEVVEGGGARISFREQKGRTTFDKKELAAAEPLDPMTVRQMLDASGEWPPNVNAILEHCRMDLGQFNRTGPSFRSFRPHRLKGTGQ